MKKSVFGMFLLLFCSLAYAELPPGHPPAGSLNQYFNVVQATSECPGGGLMSKCLSFCAPYGNYKVVIPMKYIPGSPQLMGHSKPISICGLKVQFFSNIPGHTTAFLSENRHSLTVQRVKRIGFDDLRFSFPDTKGNHVIVELDSFKPEQKIVKVVR